MSASILSSIRAEFEQAFSCFDCDGDGKISPPELQLLMRSIGQELTLEEAKRMVDSSDSDADGLLEMDEFIGLVAAEQEESKGCVAAARSLKRMPARLGSFGDV